MAGEPARGQRYLFPDAMRGVAALWVVLYHLLEGHHIDHLAPLLPAPVLALFAWGYLGVPIFFVISGFVIAHSVGMARMDAGFIGRFALRRSLRLDPPYWASIAFFLALQWLSLHFVPGKQATATSGAQLAAHAFYLQGILGYPQVNAVYWTLCLEIQFYLAWVLLLWLMQRGGAVPEASLRRLAWLGFAGSLPGLLGLLPDGVVLAWFPGLWYAFLLGAAAWLAHRAILPVPQLLGWLALAAAAGLWRHDGFALAAAATAAAFFSLGRGGRLASWPRGRMPAFLGRISYSLYLLHNPVTGAAFAVAFKLTGRSATTEALWILPVVAINIAAAAAFWYVIERPSAALASRLFARPRN